MPLFVLLTDGASLNESLIGKIKHQLKTEYSPRHVPDEILSCPDIPYTLNGKKTETLVKKILMGQSVERGMNAGSLRNPEALKFFADHFLARQTLG